MYKKYIILTIMISLMTATVAIAEKEVFIYDNHEKRDPFWFLVSSNGSILNYDKELVVSDMTLEGIIVGANGSNVAIINGNIIKPNDKIGLYSVSEITDDQVVLVIDDESFVLRIKAEE